MWILIPIVAGPIIGIGIGFMTNLTWPVTGIIFVLLGVSILLIRLLYLDIKKKRGKESK